MIHAIKRWWYRITGQADEAERLLCIALSIYALDDGKGYRLWRRDYGHIHDTMKRK